MERIKKITKEHYEKHAELCRKAGLTPERAERDGYRFMNKSKDAWCVLFDYDEWLNRGPNTSKELYCPGLGLYTREGTLYKPQYGLNSSQATGVCIVKHHIIFNIVGAKPVFVER